MTISYLVTKTEAINFKEKRASYQSFDAKPLHIRNLINEAIHILDGFGIPVADKTPRKLERMAISFLALCDVKSSGEWEQAKSLKDGYFLKTRDIIDFINLHFGENISRGSYDDIRRKDLKHPVLAGVIVSAFPESARNDPKRAWAISKEFVHVIRAYGSDGWEDKLHSFMDGKQTLRDQLANKRDILKIPIVLPSGTTLEFGPGDHNQLQKEIIEKFLPRYGYSAQVLYIGDAEDKFLFYGEPKIAKLGLLPLSHEELPDIIAFSEQKNWLYLIEAVHSSGPISAERLILLQPFLKNCTASAIFITAFLDRATFRKFVADIAWESEVWIASEPDHLIHFDGEKFLGPYESNN